MGFLNRWSVTVGRIFGIPLKLHITFFILAPILIWLFGNYFASLELEMPLWQYYGVLGAGSFLAMEISIILHELGHCWIDRKTGIAINNITLSVFGGAAFAEKEPENARNEFRMAIAGPAVSFVLAGVFFAAQRFLFENIGLNPVSLIANIIFWVNLVLVIFNIFIPAFPMDGGRILRAILWKKTGRSKATHYAVIVGKIFGIVLMAGGLALFFFMKNWLGGAIMFGIGLGLLLQKEQTRVALPTPANVKKKKSWVIALACMGSLLLVSAAIFFYSIRESDVRKINYSGPDSFMEKADKGQLRSLHSAGQVYQGTYEENGKLIKFKTIVPFQTYFYIGPNSHNLEEYYRIIYKGLHKRDLKISTEPHRALPGIETYVFYSFAFIALLAGFAAVWYWLWGKQMMQTREFLEKSARKFEGEKVSLEDIAIPEETVEDIDDLISFTTEPEIYKDIGAKIPKGYLLIGPPGTGKTLLAKIIASMAKINFLHLPGSEFVEMFVGVGASRVRDIFDQARKNAPCIIFVDEVDILLGIRGTDTGGGGRGEQNQTVAQFLAETDGIESGQGIIILGATNRLDIMDSAAIRSGRFDRKIIFDKPNIQLREKMLGIHTRNKPLAKNVDLKQLAKELKLGTSGADIANICNEAALLAVRERREKEKKLKTKIENPVVISKANFSEATDKVYWGAKNKSRLVSDEEKEITSYHEAGHAILNRHLKRLDPIRKVTIVGRGSALGYVDTAPEKENFLTTKEKYEEIGIFQLGGLAAEKAFLGIQTDGAAQDLQKATLLKLNMKYRYGMGKIGPVGLPFNIEELIKNDPFNPALLKAVEEIAPETQADLEKAQEILREHRGEVKKLVEELKEKETIMGDEFTKILEDAKAQTASGN